MKVTEGGTTSGPDALRRAWSAKRCRDLAHGIARELLDLLQRGGFCVDGVRAPIFLGPGLSEVVAGRPEELLERARRRQWPGEAVAAVGEDGISPRVVHLSADSRTLLASFDLVSLSGGAPCVVPRARAIDALGAQVSRLDEQSWIMEALSEEKLSGLREKLAPHHVPVVEAWRPVDEITGLLPQLQPMDWPGRRGALAWPLTERDDNVLHVCLVRDEVSQLRVVSSDAPEARDRIISFERAVRELDRHLGEWSINTGASGQPEGLVMVGPMAAEALLSRTRLLQAHEILGASALVAAVPARGLLRLQDAYPVDPGSIFALERWAQLVYTDAGSSDAMTRLSPALLVVIDGEVRGLLRSAGPEPSGDEASLDLSTGGRAGRATFVATRPEVEAYAREEQRRRWALVFASLLLPGLGQWWDGRPVSAGVLGGLELMGLILLIAWLPAWWPGVLWLLVVHALAALHAAWRAR